MADEKAPGERVAKKAKESAPKGRELHGEIVADPKEYVAINVSWDVDEKHPEVGDLLVRATDEDRYQKAEAPPAGPPRRIGIVVAVQAGLVVLATAGTFRRTACSDAVIAAVDAGVLDIRLR